MKKQNNSVNSTPIAKTGVGILIDQTVRALFKLPMLDLIYDKFLSSLMMPLRDILNVNVSVSGDQMRSSKFVDYIKETKDGAVFGIYSSQELSGPFMICISKDLLFISIALLLGGEKIEKQSIAKEFTQIEMEVIKYLFDLFAKSFCTAFNIVMPFNYAVDHIEIDKKSLNIIKQDDVLCILRCVISVESASGSFDVILPYSSLESIRSALSKQFLEDQILQDPMWFDHFEKEIRNTRVKLQLVLDGSLSKISEMLSLKVGSTVILDKFAEEPMEVAINGVNVTLGKLGKAGDKVAVQLLEDINIAKFNHIL